MLIALFPNELKQNSLKIAGEVCRFLKYNGIEVAAEENIASNIGAKSLTQELMQRVDFRISLGGDGTILRLVHRHPRLNAPLLGINLGSLGFLADIPQDDIIPCLEDLIQGRYDIQKRMMMEGKTSKGDACFAVNEIVIHRAQNPCLVDLAIYVDEKYVNTFSADGIILSTPSGSTAYSLAAGGPILTPELNAFVITPICPHTITNRPIVLMPKHEIRIQYSSSYLPVEVTYDGISTFSMATGESFIAKESNERFRLVHLNSRHDYYYTLREKLGWQGKLKSSASS